VDVHYRQKLWIPVYDQWPTGHRSSDLGLSQWWVFMVLALVFLIKLLLDQLSWKKWASVIFMREMSNKTEISCEKCHFHKRNEQPSWKYLFSWRWEKYSHENIFLWTCHMNRHENVYFCVGEPHTLTKNMYISWRYYITLIKMIGEPVSWEADHFHERNNSSSHEKVS
jgi:hypothetical protein